MTGEPSSASPPSSALDYTIAQVKQSGARPGTLIVPPDSPMPDLQVCRYNAEAFETLAVSLPAEIPGLRTPGRILWLDVNGLGDAGVIADIGEAFGFHRLSLEDVMSLNQRPKVEDYGDYLFAVAQFPLLDEPQPFEQISLFIGPDYLVTFQAYSTDRLLPVRTRVENPVTRVRRSGPDYLGYAVLDLIVDAYFPVLDRYDQRLEEIELSIKNRTISSEIEELFSVKRALAHIRRYMWGTRDAMNFFTREEHPVINTASQVYFRDVQDHAVRIIEFSETARETCTALTDYHLTQQGQRMNEIMKVLTIIATIFIPLTFVAGIYGMNFDTEASPFNMPELGWSYAYPVFWIVILCIAAAMFIWFYRLGWIGPQPSDDAKDR